MENFLKEKRAIAKILRQMRESSDSGCCQVVSLARAKAINRLAEAIQALDAASSMLHCSSAVAAGGQVFEMEDGIEKRRFNTLTV